MAQPILQVDEVTGDIMTQMIMEAIDDWITVLDDMSEAAIGNMLRFRHEREGQIKGRGVEPSCSRYYEAEDIIIFTTSLINAYVIMNRNGNRRNQRRAGQHRHRRRLRQGMNHRHRCANEASTDPARAAATVVKSGVLSPPTVRSCSGGCAGATFLEPTMEKTSWTRLRGCPNGPIASHNIGSGSVSGRLVGKLFDSLSRMG